ncbi:exopolygalacturonase-like [Dioscorea cayenensis subsp. rotundata]|uniref:Exopolygalacturonase n=1 Tax=Dioscorea cayennensis subsp. rotundata TaxID=55577 RepID=A0AB40BFC9_DIOCR|nr:exopolygalacturonase-like [Dioscorea cayenensis subsp. rotundata]
MKGFSLRSGKIFVFVLWILLSMNEFMLFSAKVFNVKKFGAVGDGKTDSTKAFEIAWKKACKNRGKPRVVIPEGVFLIRPLVLRGPCKSHKMHVHVEGVVKAPINITVFKNKKEWILFQHVERVIVSGYGKFDGRGAFAWPLNQCTKQKHCNFLPSSIKFNYVTNGTIQGISSVNSKSFHLSIHNSKHIKLHDIKISAPEDSPNTDGIHITDSSNVTITRSIIGTGDDCISIGPGSRRVLISGVFCGPGHGISVGSLGRYENERDVVGLRVRNCTLTGTRNGVRVKTWPASPKSSASHLVFEDILMNNVHNPIFIDQNYSPYGPSKKQRPSEVQIRKVRFDKIRGTSASKVAVRLMCSKAVPCQDVELSDIDLRYHELGQSTLASCANVHGVSKGLLKPPPCF